MELIELWSNTYNSRQGAYNFRKMKFRDVLDIRFWISHYFLLSSSGKNIDWCWIVQPGNLLI